METAAFPSLTSVGEGLRFHANCQLSTIALPELKTVGVDQEVSVSLWQLPHLTSLSVPKLVSTPAQFFIFALGDELAAWATTTVNFAGLETVTGNFAIGGMPRLKYTEPPQCRIKPLSLTSSSPLPLDPKTYGPKTSSTRSSST